MLDNRENITTFLYILAMAIFATAVLAFVLSLDASCEEKGGKRLRGQFDLMYECYDANALKTLP